VNAIIAGHFHFPSGGAPAARIRNLALGLQECGVDVHVIAMAPPTGPFQGSRMAGSPPITYENVALFANKQSNQPNPIDTAGRRLRWMVGLYGAVFPAMRRLQQRIHSHECDLFVGYGRNTVLLAPMVHLCRRHNVPTVLDVTEIPEQFSGWGGRLNPGYWDTQLGTNWLPQRFDTLSVITYGLQERYTRLGCQRTLVIPSIEGWADLPAIQPLPANTQFRLIYVGALIERDAPELLFAALRLLRERGVQVSVDMVGRYATNAQGRHRADQVRSDPVLHSCVNLLGAVSDEELMAYLRNADGLVLMRRDAPTEVNAFPTRLVEYLKQGRPVFVSDVGDIGRYLRHRIDAILLSPSDACHVADAIQEVVESSDRGFALGIQGRERGEAVFERRVHVRRLLDFVAQQATMTV